MGYTQKPQSFIRFLEFGERKREARETIKKIRERVALIPGAELAVEARKKGPPTGPPINIELFGDDFTVLGELAEKIKQEIAGIPHVQEVRDDFQQGSPTLHVLVDRSRAALLGLNTDIVGNVIRSAFNGTEVSTYREGDDDYDLDEEDDEY